MLQPYRSLPLHTVATVSQSEQPAKRGRTMTNPAPKGTTFRPYKTQWKIFSRKHLVVSKPMYFNNHYINFIFGFGKTFASAILHTHALLRPLSLPLILLFVLLEPLWLNMNYDCIQCSLVSVQATACDNNWRFVCTNAHYTMFAAVRDNSHKLKNHFSFRNTHTPFMEDNKIICHTWSVTVEISQLQNGWVRPKFSSRMCVSILFYQVYFMKWVIFYGGIFVKQSGKNIHTRIKQCVGLTCICACEFCE